MWVGEHEARHRRTQHRASSCPSWARTRTLLIQSLGLSLQLAPDFVLDGLWQGFRVPTLRYVDGHTLRVQHAAMIVALRGTVLHGLCGGLFGYRSGPGDELVTDSGGG